MFESLFRSVLTMSAGASLVILVVLALRIALRKAPKRFSYILWTLVIIRLLCPVFPESGISLMPGDVDMAAVLEAVTDQNEETAQSLEPSASVDVPELAPQYPVAQKPSTETVTPQQPSAGESIQPPMQVLPEQPAIDKPLTQMPKLDGWQIGSVVWLAGIWVMALYGVWSLFRLKSRLVASVVLGGGVYLADHIDTPFVMGLFRPKIYLPSYLKPEKAEFIILHEKYHIKRFDHVVKLLYFTALCLHWFNPLVWLAFVLMGHDMEMSCDEAVMEKLTQDVRRDYAASLLQLSTGRRKIAPTPLAFGEGDPKGRIKNVLNYRKPRFWIVLVAVVVCVVAAVCLLTNPVETDKEYLNYPGLQWGMSPEEVKSALELDEKLIINEDSSDGDPQAPLSVPSRYLIEAEGLTCFGEKTALARFHFTDYTAESDYGLERIELFYPDEESDDPVDMEKIAAKMSRRYGDAAEEYQQYEEMVGFGNAEIKSYPIADGTSYWFSEQNLDAYLTQEKKDLIYQVYLDAHADDDYPVLDRDLYDLRHQANPLVTVKSTDSYFGSGGSETEREFGCTDNYVHMNANGMRYIDAFLELYKDGFQPTDEVITESTEPTQSEDSDPLLNYPGLQWGMTIEEVKSALGFGDDAIVNVEDRGDVMGYYVEGLNYFDLPTEQILLNFTSYHGNPWGLYEVVVLLPDDTDMERAKQTVTAYYGEPIDSYSYPDLLSGKTITEKSEEGNDLWLSEVTSGNTFSEAELEFCWQYWKEQYAGGFEITKENVMENLRTTPLTRLNLTDDLHRKVFNVDHPDLEKIKCVRYFSTVYDMEQFFEYHREEVAQIQQSYDAALLNYPGLDWGMTIEEVKSALGFGNDAITEEIEREINVTTYFVENLDYFGMPTESVVFSFSSLAMLDDGERGLYEVIVHLPDDTDMEKAKQTVTAYYGEPIDSYTYTHDNGKSATEKSEKGNDLWLSEATTGNTFSEAELEFYWQWFGTMYSDLHLGVTKDSLMESLHTTPLVRMNLSDDLYGKVYNYDSPDREIVKAVRYNSNVYAKVQFFDHYREQVEHIGMLNYPLLDWGMTPEEVQTILGYSDGDVEINDGGQVLRYNVKGLHYMGLPTEGVQFSYTSSFQGSQWGLYEVVVVLPDDTDMESTKQIISSYYGNPIDSYTYTRIDDGKPVTEKSEEGNDLWLSQSTIGNTFSQAEQEYYWQFYEENYSDILPDLAEEGFMEGLQTTPLVRMNLTDDLWGKVFPDFPDMETIKAVRYDSDVTDYEQFFACYADEIG